MKIAVAREYREGETRVAMVPELVGKLTALGYEVLVVPGAGEGAQYADEEYTAAGAMIADDAVAAADLVVSVQPLESSVVRGLREGVSTVSFLPVNQSHHLVADLRDAGVTAFAMELVPRISRAQSMDALSSQALVAGYRSAIVAAGLLRRFFPLNMTAAGTVPPAQIVVLGAGVAGLQAIATAKRLGAVVKAYDVRAAAAEEIRSMGAVAIDLELETLEGTGGYAREMTEDRAARQRDLLAPYIAAADGLITTAAVPGRQAPMLVTAEMVEQMGAGSVVVDLAAETGGNVEGSQPGQVVRIGRAQVWGGANVPAQMPGPASKLYAQNIVNIVTLMTRTASDDQPAAFAPDFDDEIVSGSAVTHDHRIVHGPTREAIEGPPVGRAARASAGRACRDPRRDRGAAVSEPIVWLTIFVLSVFVGIEVISKVSSTLHTPLMSGANAIHGIILLGAILVTGTTDNDGRGRGRAGRDRARRGEHGRRLRGDRPDAADVRAQEGLDRLDHRERLDHRGRPSEPHLGPADLPGLRGRLHPRAQGALGAEDRTHRQPDRRRRGRRRLHGPLLLRRPEACAADPGRDRGRHRRWPGRRPARADDPDAADGGAVQRRRRWRGRAGRPPRAARAARRRSRPRLVHAGWRRRSRSWSARCPSRARSSRS